MYETAYIANESAEHRDSKVYRVEAAIRQLARAVSFLHDLRKELLEGEILPTEDPNLKEPPPTNRPLAVLIHTIPEDIGRSTEQIDDCIRTIREALT